MATGWIGGVPTPNQCKSVEVFNKYNQTQTVTVYYLLKSNGGSQSIRIGTDIVPGTSFVFQQMPVVIGGAKFWAFVDYVQSNSKKLVVEPAGIVEKLTIHIQSDGELLQLA